MMSAALAKAIIAQPKNLSHLEPDFLTITFCSTPYYFCF